MALTKTIDEVKEALPNFVSNLSDAASLPNLANAEYKYLVPLCGIDLYNDISDKYNNTPGSMTADEVSLLKFMRVVSLCYAFKDGLASGYLTFTDNGITKMSQAGTTELRKWEYEKIDSELLTAAYDGTEVLLSFMLEKAFALWLASDEYAKFKELLIRTGTAFDDLYKLFQPNRTFFSIRSAVADAQELYLVEGIGEDLLEYLRDLASPTDALVKALGFLKKALAFFTIRRCTEHYNVRFSDSGFTVASDTGIDAANEFGRRDAGDKTIEIKMRACEESGQTFLSKARQALYDHYKAGAATEFKTAYEAGPLVNFVEQSDRTSGNENRTGVFVL